MTIDEIMEGYKRVIGDRADEDTIGFSKVLVDNYGKPTESEDYKERYKNLLREYQSRFFTRGDKAETETEIVREKTEEIKDYDDLFKEEK